MISTGRLFGFTSIVIASAASSLSGQTGVRFGDAWPTTNLTASQRTFAESYLAAVTGPDIERYKLLLHPSTRACINNETANYFNWIFKRRVGQPANKPRLAVETLPEKFAMIDALAAQGLNYGIRPTHAFNIDLVPTGVNQSSIVAFAALDKGVWYEVLPCPSPKALEGMKLVEKREEVEMAKARKLASSMRDPLRAEILALLKRDDSLTAMQRYSEAAHVDLTMAVRVIRILEQEKQ